MANILALVRGRSGNIAIITALLMPLFVFTMSMAVDLTRIYSSKRNLQQSLDSAALAAGKEFGKTKDQAELKRWAEAFFFTNVGADFQEGTAFNYDGVRQENGYSILKVSATRDQPTYFGKAVKAVTGGQVDRVTWPIDLVSEIVIENRSVEMALVLDNSGSMDKSPATGGSSKMTVLKDATDKLVKQLMAPNPNSNVPNPVKIGVVPFSGAVNVGPSNADASWMDTTGKSPMHHENFDWSTWKVLGVSQAAFANGIWKHVVTGVPLTRFYLLKNMRYGANVRFPQGWKGCIESRPSGLAITDTEPVASNPASLFVPMFGPSEYKWNGTGDTIVRNDYIPDASNAGGNSDVAALTRQRDMSRYFDTSIKTKTSTSIDLGPNFICDTTPVTPLSDSLNTISAAVAAMKPKGATNIPEGLAWGWRVLSDRAPFTEAKPAQSESNLKVLILMTDGDPTYNPTYANGSALDVANANASMYGTHGYGQILKNNAVQLGRIFDATKTTQKKSDGKNYVDALHEMTTAVCENIKADGKNPDGSDGIVIFAIAFDLPDTSLIKKRLQACSSSGLDGKGEKLYYDAKSSVDLLLAFSAITSEISSLRLSR